MNHTYTYKGGTMFEDIESWFENLVWDNNIDPDDLRIRMIAEGVE